MNYKSFIFIFYLLGLMYLEVNEKYLHSKNTDSNTIKTAIKRSTLETKNTSISMVVDTYLLWIIIGR